MTTTPDTLTAQTMATIVIMGIQKESLAARGIAVFLHELLVVNPDFRHCELELQARRFLLRRLEQVPRRVAARRPFVDGLGAQRRDDAEQDVIQGPYQPSEVLPHGHYSFYIQTGAGRGVMVSSSPNKATRSLMIKGDTPRP